LEGIVPSGAECGRLFDSVQLWEDGWGMMHGPTKGHAILGKLQMKTPNEFWLCVHRLAEAISSEGAASDERMKNIIDEFRGMPAISQREVLADLLQLAVHCPELYTQVAPLVNENERNKGNAAPQPVG
jgi:hypothetical protein